MIASNEQTSTFSIVIASLGGKQLVSTIRSVYESTVIPKEIIIVIPEEKKDEATIISSKEIYYHFVNFKGQVAQRIFGFNKVKESIVIQLDDDIIIDSKCFEILISKLTKIGESAAVGPYFHFYRKEPVYVMEKGIKSLFHNLIIFFVGGGKWGVKRLGTIGGNGVGYGVDFDVLNCDLIEAEWLAGGCVAHYKKNLIKENYFMFPGKAYGEDLMQSILLSKNKIKLFVIKDAICYIEKPILEPDNYNLRRDYLSRKQIVKMKSQNQFRLYLWYLLRSCYKLIGK